MVTAQKELFESVEFYSEDCLEMGDHTTGKRLLYGHCSGLLGDRAVQVSAVILR